MFGLLSTSPVNVTLQVSHLTLANKPAVPSTQVNGIEEALLIGFYEEAEVHPFVTAMQEQFSFRIRYLREYQPLGTGGGLFHFRDVILSGGPEMFFGVCTCMCLCMCMWVWVWVWACGCVGLGFGGGSASASATCTSSSPSVLAVASSISVMSSPREAT